MLLSNVIMHHLKIKKQKNIFFQVFIFYGYFLVTY